MRRRSETSIKPMAEAMTTAAKAVVGKCQRRSGAATISKATASAPTIPVTCVLAPAASATGVRDELQLVEEGVDGVLTPKRSPNSARRGIFDGASEAKLIALACSTPPEGFARWTLQMLESKAVELNIVARASDNTIGRTLKKTFSVRQAKLALSSRWKSGGGKAVASRPLASVAGPPVTTVAKCTQQSCGVGY